MLRRKQLIILRTSEYSCSHIVMFYKPAKTEDTEQVGKTEVRFFQASGHVFSSNDQLMTLIYVVLSKDIICWFTNI